MKILNLYDEFGRGMGFPSMKEFFQSEKYENQDKIVRYLRTGEPCMVQTMLPRDVFTGEPLGIEKYFINDGEYIWNSDLAYYVEKYNLKLSDEFTQHVLTKLKNNKHFAN